MRNATDTKLFLIDIVDDWKKLPLSEFCKKYRVLPVDSYGLAQCAVLALDVRNKWRYKK